jgi:hypothetical protein
MELSMRLDEIQQQFLEKMMQVEFNKITAIKIAENSLEEVRELESFVGSNPDKIELTSTLHPYFFRKASNGDYRSYGFPEVTLASRRQYISDIKNRQFQWLLAEAYEEFENSLKKVYAYCGMNDPYFWPLEDYGNKSLDEIGQEDFEWHLERTKAKRNAPRSILKQIRARRPQLLNVEETNALGTNLDFAITLVEKFRHIIVHRSGVVGRLDRFVESILKTAPAGATKEEKEAYQKFILRHLKAHPDGHVINLVYPAPPEVGTAGPFYDPFSQLFNFIIAYLDLIIELVDDRTEVWDREEPHEI